MRSKLDFAGLVFEKADKLKEADRKKKLYMRASLSAAAGICLVTVIGGGRFPGLHSPDMNSSLGSSENAEGAVSVSAYDTAEKENNEVGNSFGEQDITDGNNVTNNMSEAFAMSTAENIDIPENDAEAIEHDSIGDNEFNDMYYNDSVYLETITYIPENGVGSTVTDEDSVYAVKKAMNNMQYNYIDTTDETVIGKMIITGTNTEDRTMTVRTVVIYSSCIEFEDEMYVYDSDNNLVEHIGSDMIGICDMSDEFIDVMRTYVDESFMIE